VPDILLAQCTTISPISAETLGAVQSAIIELFTWARLAVTDKLLLPRKVEMPPTVSRSLIAKTHIYEAGSEAPANLL
jgi:hypothetical protein